MDAGLGRGPTQRLVPLVRSSTLHLAGGNLLSQDEPRPSGSAEDTYQVDFSIGTGNDTRYERIAAIDARSYYTTWQGRTDEMLSYTSEPLPTPVALAGHAIADLWISATEPDAALFVYLTEIEADGPHRYVTEGLLRLLHRRESPQPRPTTARRGPTTPSAATTPNRSSRVNPSMSAFPCCQPLGGSQQAAGSGSPSQVSTPTTAPRSRTAGRRRSPSSATAPICRHCTFPSSRSSGRVVVVPLELRDRPSRRSGRQ
ncbi:X-Pro dipeptidyl-peptidase-like protein [Saccharopolyspora erythraea NRRL 2338]|uniref:Xaa-Pro dipeptidyl-peptidase C-terminal domain-containing protein n=1 Tax=Saccharopolyspora erythraea TaxID=1836 RepID=A0ABN1DKW6_SACER|nr:X-Pro dipeptidyl-peptidase-like protein [Saccharopolyspora erythraea NRRL 2338]QRK92374.1 hypothetical protein JQX30_14265 [Saccharopolyspora erythraea]